MRTSRKSIIAVLVVLLLLVLAPAALASGRPVSITHEVVDGTVDWTIPAGQCDKVPVTLTGTGKRHELITTKVYADGSQEIVIDDVVNGTASDSTGKYHFLYVNHSKETVPVGAGAHRVAMDDVFLLQGTGSAKLNVGFIWRWTYTPPAELWPPVDNWQQIKTWGDPFSCDPI